ncbi:hypothetical protein NNJEOMEG_00981 [Fundidesulfovibrio magnetotacticus]|uniref:Uncharacterized protein n=1 Tax=Fundidesulfovibrio magnetotacticus TaxID=2730080 RepID=A0A6V8LQA0_9BACT|nr:hypothetical protein [Fundidesulfovibrio magnetotacticus]GFK93150.1 hypothetical protein NNJEOMEG_00981 [Fundidesulfovibrio magnetotacticus]
MLGLEKRVDAIREMQGSENVEPDTPASNSARTGIMLALVAILVAAAVYLALEGKYSAKMTAYEGRIAAMETKVAEASNAPRELARKMIAQGVVGEMTTKATQLKTQLDASYQERLAKVEETLKSIQQDLAK